MARDSLVPGRIKNTGIDLLIGAALIGGAVLLVGYGNKKYNILGKIVSGFQSIGTSVGQAVGAGVSSIPVGVGVGAASVLSPQGGANNLSRASLGLSPESPTCTYIPFTNIPLPGSKCGNNLGTTSPPDSGNLPAVNTAPSVGPVSSNRPVDRSSSTSNNQPGSNLVPSTIKPALTNPVTGSSGGVINNDISTVTLGTLIQNTQSSLAKPLNTTLTSLINTGTPVYSTTISTQRGGTRTVTGSAGLIQRLASNLGVK